MAKYSERYLNEDEWVVEKAKRNPWPLVGCWIVGVLFFWVLFIPLIYAIVRTVVFKKAELVLTNMRLICKRGVFNTESKDVTLPKVQGVYVNEGFWGKVFNVGTIHIDTAYGPIEAEIQDAEDFKTAINGQVEQYKLDHLAKQAQWTAQEMKRGAGNPYAIAPTPTPVPAENKVKEAAKPQLVKTQPVVAASPSIVDPNGGYGYDIYTERKIK